MIHNVIVVMRKEFDSLSYFTDVKERNKMINRLKYHRKKEIKIQKQIDDVFIEEF